ncbi:MAG: TldD/PmbA family protein [Terriglobales bacterium]|jgi:PmbA protein
MITREQAHDIFQRAAKLSEADEVEVLIGGASSALTRFANNTIHQNVADENHVVSIRVAFDQRTARASTNKFDNQSLKRTVEAAEEMARVQHPDSDLLPLADPKLAPAGKLPQRAFDSTRALGPSERAEIVAKIVDVATRNHLTTAGICSTSDSIEGIFNSRGLAAFHQQTIAEVSITMLAADSSGWQKLNSPDARDVDPVALAETAAKKARDSAHPAQIDPGKYTVILEPSAVLDIVGYMFYDFGGLSVLDQRSFLNERVGKQLFGENITIHDDSHHPLQAGAPFDGEGVARERVTLVKDGVINSLVFARGTAQRGKNSPLAAYLGSVRATGHGFPLPNEMGEAPMNIVFENAPSNRKTGDEMIASTDRGIYVTRLWYIREVEPYEKVLTGMTRDGTLLIENGKITRGLRNFRFNESLVEMLSKVDAMSEPVRACGEESFDMVVPAMKVRDFNFTEVTKF